MDYPLNHKLYLLVDESRLISYGISLKRAAMTLIELGGRTLTADDVRGLLATDHPMVEEFRFVKTHDSKGHRIHFSLVILPKKGVRYMQQRNAMGQRIEPEWKTLTGEEKIGQGNRVRLDRR